jgi:hypothetical protein
MNFLFNIDEKKKIENKIDIKKNSKIFKDKNINLTDN